MAVSVKAPAVVVDGPPPIAPPYSLLEIPGVAQVREDDHWLNGAGVIGYPEGPPHLWEPCGAGTMREKDGTNDIPSGTFGPFGVYVAVSCTARGIDWEDWRQRAEATLTATQSFAVEQALSQGIAGSSNSFFGDGNVATPAGTTAQTPDNALAYLEEAIGETGRQGLIHATPGVGSQWGFGKLDTNGTAYTANGTPVALGGGYVGGVADGNAAAAGTAWAYATGPVRVYLSSIQAGNNPAATMNRETNDFEIIAERFVVAFWDTALQAAVKVDWTT